MLFTATIMCGADLKGRATVQTHEAATPDDLATLARAALLDSALGVRRARSEQVMTLSTLHRFAKLFGEVVEDQQHSGESRYVTAYTRGGEEVYHSEGQIALLGSRDDITCIIEATDDETLARNSLHAEAVRKLGRQPTPADIVMEDATVEDLFRSK